MAYPPIAEPQTAPLPVPRSKTIDPADPDFSGWFLPQRQLHDKSKKPTVNQIAWASNQVDTFLSGLEYFKALGDEIKKCNKASHFIYMVGLALDLSADTSGGTATPVTFETVLREVSANGVQIRALYQNFDTNKSNLDIINSFAGSVGAVTQPPVPMAHHQKVVVISGQDGMVGFCGGMDVHPHRNHWHDVQCRVRGGATQDLHRNFFERWTNDPGVLALSKEKQSVVTPTKKDGGPGELTVQMVRTFPRSYDFVPSGEHTIYELLQKAILRSQKFIYMEDQYLVNASSMRFGPAISTLLAKKLAEKSFQKLVILISPTQTINDELANIGWWRREKFITEFLNAAEDKVIVCQYKRINPNAPFSFANPNLVHSKTWIFDDRFAVIGSANCDRVGYSRNSEIGVGIADKNPRGNRASFAHMLRIKLWRKHLNPAGADRPFQEEHLADPFKGIPYWISPLPESPIEVYDPKAYLRLPPTHPPQDDPNVKPANRDRVWDAYDPDGS